jgi:hypothetical protein
LINVFGIEYESEFHDIFILIDFQVIIFYDICQLLEQNQVRCDECGGNKKSVRWIVLMMEYSNCRFEGWNVQTSKFESITHIELD